MTEDQTAASAETTPASTPQVLPKSEVDRIIEDEKIMVADLPPAINEKIKALKMQRGRYLTKPSKNLYESVVKQDILIADTIQNWLERDLEEEQEAPAPIESPAPPTPPAEEVAPVVAEVVPPPPVEATPPPAPPTPPPPAEKSEFLKIIESEGRISVSDYRRITKKKDSEIGSQEVFEGVKLNRGLSMISIGYYYPTQE